MPLDGNATNIMPAIIDKAMAILGPNGEFWWRCGALNGDKRCPVQALVDAVAALYPGNIALAHRVVDAVGDVAAQQWHNGMSGMTALVVVNDQLRQYDFRAIKLILEAARAHFIGAFETDGLLAASTQRGWAFGAGVFFPGPRGHCGRASGVFISGWALAFEPIHA